MYFPKAFAGPWDMIHDKSFLNRGELPESFYKRMTLIAILLWVGCRTPVKIHSAIAWMFYLTASLTYGC